MESVTLGLVIGFVLGMRHALEPDHLTAVATLVQVRNRRSTAFLGACWGIGHSVSLLAVGCILAALNARLPTSVADAFEILVGAMLVTLGLRAIWNARLSATSGPPSAHEHWTGTHAHAAGVPHVHVGPWTLAWRPLLVGLVHGLAGSGALTALVMAELPTLGTRLAYIIFFGFGSVIGMGFLTGLVGWQLRRIGLKRNWGRALGWVTGVASVGLGGWWGWTAALSLFRA